MTSLTHSFSFRGSLEHHSRRLAANIVYWPYEGRAVIIQKLVIPFIYFPAMLCTGRLRTNIITSGLLLLINSFCSCQLLHPETSIPRDHFGMHVAFPETSPVVPPLPLLSMLPRTLFLHPVGSLPQRLVCRTELNSIESESV